jgi:hypothetical protein
MRKTLLRTILIALFLVAGSSTNMLASGGSIPMPICAPGDAGCPS